MDQPDGGNEACPATANIPPSAPTLIAPDPAHRIVIPDQLVLETSPMTDPDGGELSETQFELWLTAGGEPLEKVWVATLDDPQRMTRAVLADGEFEPGYDRLAEWTQYAARARHRDESPCGWSEWSPVLVFRTDDGSEALFADDVVHDFYIDIPPASWNAINDQAIGPWCQPFFRSYHSGTLRFGNQEFAGAGVRIKGGSGSQRSLSGKAGLKVHLSWADPALASCPLERRLLGLERLTFNNMVQDKSFVRERLAYRLYDALGVETPRVAPVRLFVNDALWGLYLHVESFDRRFLARRYASHRGMLYEGNCYCDFDPDDVPNDGDVEFCFERKFIADECSPLRDGDDQTSFSLLKGLTERIEAMPTGQFYPEIQDFFEFDQFLSMWAADVLLNNWDGHIFEAHNYRIYHEPTADRWSVIPSGLDQTFSYQMDNGTPIEVSAFNPRSLLASRCLQDSDCKDAFAARLSSAIDIFEAADLDLLARELEAEVNALVAEDPRKEGSSQRFHDEVDEVVDYIHDRPADARAMLSAQGY